jgi:hypothetical protein
MTIRQSTITVDAGVTRFGVFVGGVGTKTVLIEHSRIGTTAGQPTINAQGNGLAVFVAASQLAGGVTSQTGGASIRCAGVYDEGFIFTAGSACP